MSYEIAKAGWMMRESAILKRWKKTYFVLYRDGVFKYFEDDRSATPEEVMIVKQPYVLKIKEGLNLVDVSPPAGYSRGCLLKVKSSEKDKSWMMCADSPDDMSAWKMTLEEANRIPYKPPPKQVTTRQTTSYTTYPAASQTYTAYPTNQTTTVYQTGTAGYPGTTTQTVYPGTTQTVYPGTTQTVYPSGTTTQTVYMTGQPYGTVVQPAQTQTQTIVVAQPSHRCGRYGCTANHHHGGYYSAYDDWWW